MHRTIRDLNIYTRSYFDKYNGITLEHVPVNNYMDVLGGVELLLSANSVESLGNGAQTFVEPEKIICLSNKRAFNL